MNEVSGRVLSALRVAGETGLHIDELATSLGISSKKLTKTIEKLTSEGIVMQKQKLKEERYVIKQMNGEPEHGGVGDLNGCPCFHCLSIGRCGVRQPDSPISCRELEQWMISSNLN
jgi:biotin operon repressor